MKRVIFQVLGDIHQSLCRFKGSNFGVEARQQRPKSPTGIQGLDEITGGSLLTGRPTLVRGVAGCGKTLPGIEFQVRGADT